MLDEKKNGEGRRAGNVNPVYAIIKMTSAANRSNKTKRNYSGTNLVFQLSKAHLRIFDYRIFQRLSLQA